MCMIVNLPNLFFSHLVLFGHLMYMIISIPGLFFFGLVVIFGHLMYIAVSVLSLSLSSCNTFWTPYVMACSWLHRSSRKTDWGRCFWGKNEKVISETVGIHFLGGEGGGFLVEKQVEGTKGGFRINDNVPEIQMGYHFHANLGTVAQI